MKITLYLIAYFPLLFPTFLVALNRLVDIADPPIIRPETGDSFWLTGLGQCLWFGAAFILPALVVFPPPVFRPSSFGSPLSFVVGSVPVPSVSPVFLGRPGTRFPSGDPVTDVYSSSVTAWTSFR